MQGKRTKENCWNILLWQKSIVIDLHMWSLLEWVTARCLFQVLEREGPSCLGRESRAGKEIVFKLEFGVFFCLGGSDRPPSGLARLGCLLLLLRDLQGAPEEHAGQGGGRRMASWPKLLPKFPSASEQSLVRWRHPYPHSKSIYISDLAYSYFWPHISTWFVTWLSIAAITFIFSLYQRKILLIALLSHFWVVVNSYYYIH